MDSKPIDIPKQIFRILYNVDRKLYSILVFEIGYDPMNSLQIIAFWNWLEQTGFNITQTFLSLRRNLISGLAEDAVTCLECIRHVQFLLSPAARDIVLTQCVLGKGLSLQYLHEKCGIGKIFDEIYAKALTDMMTMPPPNRNSEMMLPPQTEVDLMDQFGQLGLGGQSSEARPQRNGGVPFEDRTMSVAFSSGFPVYEWEISEFITGAFGNCIESIQMQAVMPYEQLLLYAHAHVVFFSPATINSILQGAQVAKFTVNGKDMWMSKHQHPPS